LNFWFSATLPPLAGWSGGGGFLGLGWQKLFVENTKASLQHVQPFSHLTQMTGR
jgi:hypothetical protein